MVDSPLKNLRFLVTGASSGIGAATAELLVQRGAHVLLLARREGKLQSFQQELEKKYPGARALALALDVTAPDFLKQLEDRGGLNLHGLINNAGLALGRDPVEKARWSDAQTMLQVNIDGALRLCHAVVPRMLAQGHGDIVNLCSIAGHRTYQGGAVYCATKHAIHAFTCALREETCGRNLRVMQVSPGMVETEFSVVRFKGNQELADKTYAGMRPLTGMDIARQILFMLEQPRHICIDEIISMPTAQGAPTTVVRGPA